MDAAKATELEAAMHDADAASAQTDASLPNIPLALAPAESAPGQSHVQSGIGSTGHLPHLASTAAASHGTASTENFRVSNQAPHKPITDTHMDELSAAAEARVGPKGRDAALQRLASSKDNAETSASASVVEPSSAAASKRERGVEQGLSANPQAGSGMSNERSRLESDAQHSVSPAGVQGVDKHPLSKGKADSTAGKGTEAQQADAGVVTKQNTHPCCSQFCCVAPS